MQLVLALQTTSRSSCLTTIMVKSSDYRQATRVQERVVSGCISILNILVAQDLTNGQTATI